MWTWPGGSSRQDREPEVGLGGASGGAGSHAAAVPPPSLLCCPCTWPREMLGCVFKGRSLTGVGAQVNVICSLIHSLSHQPNVDRGFLGAGLRPRAQNRKADEPRPCPPDGQTGLVVHGDRHAAKDPWAASELPPSDLEVVGGCAHLRSTSWRKLDL